MTPGELEDKGADGNRENHLHQAREVIMVNVGPGDFLEVISFPQPEDVLSPGPILDQAIDRLKRAQTNESGQQRLKLPRLHATGIKGDGEE